MSADTPRPASFRIIVVVRCLSFAQQNDTVASFTENYNSATIMCPGAARKGNRHPDLATYAMGTGLDRNLAEWAIHPMDRMSRAD
jgi:hypothetical protein